MTRYDIGMTFHAELKSHDKKTLVPVRHVAKWRSPRWTFPKSRHLSFLPCFAFARPCPCLLSRLPGREVLQAGRSCSSSFCARPQMLQRANLVEQSLLQSCSGCPRASPALAALPSPSRTRGIIFNDIVCITSSFILYLGSNSTIIFRVSVLSVTILSESLA